MTAGVTTAERRPEDGTQRLVLLWLSWIVLALFLLAAGVVVLGG